MELFLIVALVIIIALGIAALIYTAMRRRVNDVREIAPAPLPEPTEREIASAGMATVLYAGAITLAVTLIARRALKLARDFQGTEIAVKLPPAAAKEMRATLRPLRQRFGMKPSAAGTGYAPTLLKIASRAINLDVQSK